MTDQNIRTYFIPPLYNQRTYEYLNINKDKHLRFNKTEFYYNKIIKWIKKDKAFSKYNKLLPLLNTNKGFKYVYTLLRLFIKKTKINWYELNDNYTDVKDFLQHNLIIS